MDDARYVAFLTLSEGLTGFAAIELEGTGVALAYFEHIETTAPELIDAWRDAVAGCGDGDPPEQVLRNEILAKPGIGDTARLLVQLWYLGQWGDDVFSADAYREGLVWRVANAHPMGAKQQGFGTWAFPPEGDLAATAATAVQISQRSAG